MLLLGFFSPLGWEGNTGDSLVPGFPSSSQISSRHSSLSFGTGMDFPSFSRRAARFDWSVHLRCLVRVQFLESDCDLPSMSVSESEPDLESKSEPEVAAASTMFPALESHVFTPQYIIFYVNVMIGHYFVGCESTQLPGERLRGEAG